MPLSKFWTGRGEQVVFYPTYGVRSPDGTGWALHVHGWVFRQNRRPVRRLLVDWHVRRKTRFTRRQLNSSHFRRRIAPFLVDPVEGKACEIEIGGSRHVLKASGADGHVFDTIFVDDATAQRAAATDHAPPPHDTSWLTYHLATDSASGTASPTTGAVQLIGPTGLSLITDIDDTVKITSVLDREALMRNTLLEPFRPVDGLAVVFQQWHAAGRVVHYVSSSPWQLAVPLSELFQSAGLPAGSMHLRQLRLRDLRKASALAGSETQKVRQIESILDDFPQRRFLLVGDSGERDPEMYADIARDRPDQIERIVIRNISGEDRCSPRWTSLSEDLPDVPWTLFDEPAELEKLHEH